MGFNGYPHGTQYTVDYLSTDLHTSTLGFYSNPQFDIQSPMLLRGIEYIYTWLESVITYSTTLFYESNLIPTDPTSLEHFIWVYDYRLSLYIIWSIFYDFQILNNVVSLPHISNWYSYINTITNNVVFYIEHPEHTYFYSSALTEYLLPFVSKFRFLIELETQSEGLLLIPMIILDLLFKIFLFGLFLSFLMNWYSISINSSNVDSDFLVNSLAIESEEEIASIDDTVLLLIIVFFIFGWFFFFNYLNILTVLGEVMFIFLFLPLLIYILFFIPIFLLIDYGMHFITYLRGAGSSSALLMEFVYDCIAFLAFFIRLSVQNVRLLLITLTFFSLYEFILFFANNNWFNANFEFLDKLSTTNNNYTSYYFFISVINKFIYWVYELLHTFFVTVAQFVAFFAMVFWLFLFLYTMFVVEEFEKYLDEKRKQRK